MLIQLFKIDAYIKKNVMTFSYQKILTLKCMYSVKTKQNKLLAPFSLFSNQMN